MTIEEAIDHAIDVARTADCEECREEHLQLADWLIELKSFRQMMNLKKEINNERRKNKN